MQPPAGISPYSWLREIGPILLGAAALITALGGVIVNIIIALKTGRKLDEQAVHLVQQDNKLVEVSTQATKNHLETTRVAEKADAIKHLVDGRATEASAQIASLKVMLESYKKQLDLKDQLLEKTEQQLAEKQGADNLAGTVVSKVDQIKNHVESAARTITSGAPIPTVNVDRRGTKSDRRINPDDKNKEG